jgi:FAD/FMN-containing dehydrogenase
VIDGIVENSSRIRSPWSYVLISQLGGAIADRDEDATAYSDRTAAHNININGVWLPYDEMGEKEIEWAREFFADMEHHGTGAYINFLDRDDQYRVRGAYGEDTYHRLERTKALYDPDNVFCFNHNIAPSHPEPSRVQ